VKEQLLPGLRPVRRRCRFARETKIKRESDRATATKERKIRCTTRT
jgi:hypothetical protein